MDSKKPVFLRMDFWLSVLGMLIFTALCAAAPAPSQDSWKVYNGHNLSIHYPDDAKAYTMGPQKIFAKLGCGSFHGDIIFCMTHVPQSLQAAGQGHTAPPPLRSAVTISLRSNIRTSSDCRRYNDSTPEAKALGITQKSINGVTFYTLPKNVIEQDHSLMKYDLYRTFSNNTCYEVLAGYATAPDGKAPVSPQDLEQENALLNRVIATLTVTH